METVRAYLELREALLLRLLHTRIFDCMVARERETMRAHLVNKLGHLLHAFELLRMETVRAYLELREALLRTVFTNLLREISGDEHALAVLVNGSVRTVLFGEAVATTELLHKAVWANLELRQAFIRTVPFVEPVLTQVAAQAGGRSQCGDAEEDSC